MVIRQPSINLIFFVKKGNPLHETNFLFQSFNATGSVFNKFNKIYAVHFAARCSSNGRNIRNSFIVLKPFGCYNNIFLSIKKKTLIPEYKSTSMENTMSKVNYTLTTCIR
jgi:hypothetical protein